MHLFSEIVANSLIANANTQEKKWVSRGYELVLLTGISLVLYQEHSDALDADALFALSPEWTRVTALLTDPGVSLLLTIWRRRL